MTDPISLLASGYPFDPQRWRAWFSEVERSLRNEPDLWLGSLGTPGQAGLPQDASWELLGWAEAAASVAVAERRPDLIGTAAFALALVATGPLDLRDVMVVGSLLRRAADLTGADFGRLVGEGTDHVGDLGRETRQWLLLVDDKTPSTHKEVGSGADFEFQRIPANFDAAALEERLIAAQGASREQPR